MFPSETESVKGEDGGGVASEGEKPWGACPVPSRAESQFTCCSTEETEGVQVLNTERSLTISKYMAFKLLLAVKFSA